MDELWHKIEKWINSFFRGNDDEEGEFRQNDIPFAPPMTEPAEEQSIDVVTSFETEGKTETSEEESETGTIVSDPFSMGEIEPIKKQTEKEQESSKEETVVKQEKDRLDGMPKEDDKRFEKLLSKTIDTIKYYDQLAAQIANPDVKACLDDFNRKLIENLILSGCTPIDTSEGVFDMTRHRVVPFQMVEDGTPFHNLVRTGVEWNGEVKVMAIVEL